MNEELKPCPFCGSAVSLNRILGWDEWRVICAGCCAYVTFDKNKPETIAAWNCRPKARMKDDGCAVEHFNDPLARCKNGCPENKRRIDSGMLACLIICNECKNQVVQDDLKAAVRLWNKENRIHEGS